MSTKEQHNHSSAPSVKWPVWLLIADAVVYWAALFYCVLLTFFLRDGAITPVVRLTGLCVSFAVVFLSIASRHIIGDLWKRLLFFDLVIFIFLGTWLPWQFSGIGTARGLSFFWAAIEWWKLPSNILLMFKIAPVTFVCFWCAVVALIHCMATNKKRIALYALLAFIVFYTFKLTHMDAGVRLPAYLFFDVGLAIALIAGLRGHMRVFSRILIIDASFVIVFLFYLGVIPFSPVFGTKDKQNVRRIYPAPQTRAEFPLVFPRDMLVDKESGYIFTAYGPASGIVRVNINSGKADIIHNPGIVSMLMIQPGSDEFFALDSLYADFYRIGMNDFRIRRKTNLFDGRLITPVSFAVSKGKLYVISTNYPAITRFDLTTMKKEASVDFRSKKLTAFRSGTLKCALDEKNNRLFVELGPVDLRGRYIIVRIDLDDFRIEKKGYLPEGGLELVINPSDGRLLAPGFFSRNIYVVNPDTLKIERKIKGPLSSINIAIDEDGKKLYALGFAKGELMSIDYDSGLSKIMIKNVGKKPSSLFFDKRDDVLYFGSGKGVFSLINR